MRRHIRPSRLSTHAALCASATVIAAAGIVTTGLGATAASAVTLGDTAVAYAAQEAGQPYVYGSAGPSSFDCSGLVMYVYGRLGISLPHNTVLQYNAMPHIPQSDRQPGDVLFFYDSTGYLYHDAIYAGNNLMWAAPYTGAVVDLKPVYSTDYWVGRPTASGGAVTAQQSAPISTVTAPTTTLLTTNRPTLQQGSTGPAVVTLQTALHITADGDFGPQTQAAVVTFQARNGLSSDGVVGPLTWARLLPTPQSPAPVSTAARPTLQQGSTGPAVFTLQTALHITADGDFGPQTQAAVITFQTHNGLTPDGVVGPLTWVRI